MEQKTCPVCGMTGEYIKEEKAQKEFKYFTLPIKYTADIDTCIWCGTEGDFTGVNDISVTDAIDLARNTAAKEYLEELLTKYTQDQLERALGIKYGTIDKWLANGVNQTEFILLKLLKEYPNCYSAILWWSAPE